MNELASLLLQLFTSHFIAFFVASEPSPLLAIKSFRLYLIFHSLYFLRKIIRGRGHFLVISTLTASIASLMELSNSRYLLRIVSKAALNYGRSSRQLAKVTLQSHVEGADVAVGLCHSVNLHRLRRSELNVWRAQTGIDRRGMNWVAARLVVHCT